MLNHKLKNLQSFLQEASDTAFEFTSLNSEFTAIPTTYDEHFQTVLSARSEELSEILYEIALEQVFSQNSIKLVDSNGKTIECCGLDDLERGYNYVRFKARQVVEFVQSHGVAEASVTPSVGFQITQKSVLGSVDLGVAVTEGNTYKLSVFENSSGENLSTSNTDLKMHTFAKISIGTEGNGKGVKLGGSVKVDYVHDDISFEDGKVEYEVAMGPKVSGKTLGGDKYSSFNVKATLQGSAKINQKGKTFIGIDYGYKASLILGVKVNLKIGFNL